MKMMLISGTAILALLSGCASRGFVRNEVGASATTLDGRIDENQTEIAAARDDIGQVNGVNDRQTEEIQQVNADIDTASGERAEIRRNLTDVETVAGTALETARTADSRAAELSALFGSRNRLGIEAERQFQFDFDSAELKVPDGTTTAEIERLITDDPNAIVVLEGRTDSQGDDAYNLELAERRIEAVKRYLVLELGVPFFRIHTFSFGESSPLAPNDDIETRRQNRTVSMIVLTPQADSPVAGED